LYYYNYERVHSGYGMAGRTPYGCCVALGFSGSEYVGLMPVVLLDNIVLDWSRHGVPAVNDVLAHYSRRLFYQPPSQSSQIPVRVEFPPLPALSPRVKGGLKSAIFNIPAPLPLEQQNAHRVSLIL
jgi:hypothetical protein